MSCSCAPRDGWRGCREALQLRCACAGCDGLHASVLEFCGVGVKSELKAGNRGESPFQCGRRDSMLSPVQFKTVPRKVRPNA
jgi:hypothetical protein